MYVTHIQFVFFFNDTATTEIYTLSLHDALPISSSPESGSPITSVRKAATSSAVKCRSAARSSISSPRTRSRAKGSGGDRKSTRLNSSHANISYAVFCLKKKKNKQYITTIDRHLK